jgi:GT2 family glycosyltransferase
MSARRSTISVIVLTYEWPGALDVVLRALSESRDQRFDVVVADDGSGPETAAVVASWQEAFGPRLRHVWQPDDGWRISRIRNLGALEAQGEYFVFLDGDCLPRTRFVEAADRAALAGWFMATKRLHMSSGLSQRVLEERLPVWRWSTARWVLGAPREVLTASREARGFGLLLPLRDRRRPWREGQPEFTPPFDGYGFCFGVARADFERVNGWDMRFTSWGGEDVDLAIRLRRLGLRCGWPGPAATLPHLSHPPKKGTMTSNTPLVEDTRQSCRLDAVLGLRELATELRATVPS